MILTFWKYLQGYVVIKVTGFAPERFMNLCANRNIYIWNARRVPDGYIFSISKKAFFMLKPIAEKTKCRVRIQKKIGMPFKMKFFKKRMFFSIGIFLCLAVILTLSFFIWRIEIEGNESYSTDEIIQLLESHQIEVGIFKPKVDCSNIDDMLLMELDRTMWVSSELKGTKLVVHVREGVNPQIEKVDETPSDLVATKDSIIVSIMTRKGTPKVKAGDSVKKGDILVSGTLEIWELTTLKAVTFTYSDADIVIQTAYPYSDEVILKHIVKEYLPEKKNDTILALFNQDINVFKPRLGNTPYDTIEKSHQAALFENFYLPIYMRKVTYLPYNEVETFYTIEEAKEILQANFTAYVQKLKENNIQIIANDVIFKVESDKIMATGTITVTEKEGQKVVFDPDERRLTYNEYFTEEDGTSP